MLASPGQQLLDRIAADAELDQIQTHAPVVARAAQDASPGHKPQGAGQDFAAHKLTVSQQAMRRLMSYQWPGNVRQLENAIERAVAFSRGRSQIDLADLPPELRGRSAHSTAHARYSALFHDRVFIGVAIIGGMIFTAVIGLRQTKMLAGFRSR